MACLSNPEELSHPEGLSSNPGVWVFVDDSNIWIAAKQLASRVKHLKTSEDHRVRIDIGKLTTVVAAGRPVAQGFLYGSEPPPVDTVWEKIRSQHFEVNTYPKSQITRKEKQVDAQLVADITERAIITPEFERTTIIVISGDADVLPAVKKVLKYKRWNVEVYMWQHAMSSELKKLPSSNDRVKVLFLDDHLSKVTFTNMKFDVKNLESLLVHVRSSGLVLTIAKGSFRNRVPTTQWCLQLESITQLPFQYYWFEEKEELTNDLVVVFKEENAASSFELAHILELLESHSLPHVLHVQTFLHYIHAKKQYAIDAVGCYSYDDVISDPENHSPSVSRKTEESWEIVRHQSKLPYRSKKQKYSTPCPYKRNCKYGMSCNYKHTDDEKKFFHQNMGKGNPLRKVRLCNNPKCKKKAEDCSYAHGNEDAWCLICVAQGHLTDNCPNK